MEVSKVVEGVRPRMHDGLELEGLRLKVGKVYMRMRTWNGKKKKG